MVFTYPYCPGNDENAHKAVSFPHTASIDKQNGTVKTVPYCSGLLRLWRSKK